MLRSLSIAGLGLTLLSMSAAAQSAPPGPPRSNPLPQTRSRTPTNMGRPT